MKKALIVMAIILICLLVAFSIAGAKKGCCSKHGGVCGCQCCDGTALSAKCLPYYPECQKKNDTQ